MKLYSRIAVLTAAALMIPAATSQAAVVFSLGQSVVNVDAGEQATLPVYIEFTGADRATLIADGGLFSGGVKVAPQSAISAASSFVADASFNAPTFGGGFSEIVFTGVAPDRSVSLYGEITDLNAGALGTDDGTTSRVQLGSVTFTGGAAGRSDLFTLSVIDPDIASISTNAVATALRDPVTFDAAVSSLTVAVNVVPEPGAALAATVFCTIAAVRRRRMRDLLVI